MRLLFWLVVAGGLLYALHRVALWAESRGWIYYWNRKASPRALGNSALEVQALLEPGKRHVIESRLAEQSDVDVPGDEPDKGAAAEDR